ILLDFYRLAADATSASLGHIDKSHDRIVTTYQIEMEFEKNRQSVIIDTRGKAKVPELRKLQPPGVPRHRRDRESAGEEQERPRKDREAAREAHQRGPRRP